MKVAVFGVSTNQNRRSFSMVKRLKEADYEVFPFGKSEGEVEGINIITDMPEIEKIHTVVLYMKPENQQKYAGYIIHTLKPKRIIFNKNTESESLMVMADENDIEIVERCSLVMLSLEEF